MGAMAITDGSLNFGNTPHENWVTGVVMMVIGGVFLCPVCPVLFYKLCKKRSRHAAFMQSDSIFDSPRAARYNQRTVGHSPSPSRDSNSQSTEDDYRVNIQDEYYNNSRTEGSQSPRYRRGAGGGNKQKERSGYSSKDDDDVAPSGIRNAAHAYAAQPAGLVDESHLHIEMASPASFAANHTTPRRQRHGDRMYN